MAAVFFGLGSGVAMKIIRIVDPNTPKESIIQGGGSLKRSTFWHEPWIKETFLHTGWLFISWSWMSNKYYMIMNKVNIVKAQITYQLVYVRSDQLKGYWASDPTVWHAGVLFYITACVTCSTQNIFWAVRD